MNRDPQRHKFEEEQSVNLIAHPDSVAEDLAAQYMADRKAESDTYRASPEYAEQKAKWEAEDHAKLSTLEGALSQCPPHLTCAEGKQADWDKAVEVNDDPYGAAGVRYAETWARLMEGRVAGKGETIPECAKETSHIADTEGITGFMYGCAVSILSQVWVYGEELRRWSNLDIQIGDEGEKANESGEVLNPALLTIR